LSVSETAEAQTNIIRALTRKFHLDPRLDLEEVVSHCPYTYTGADFYALCSDAMLEAMGRKAGEVEKNIAQFQSVHPGHPHPQTITPQYFLAALARPEDIEVLVSAEDFNAARDRLTPSVSHDELMHYRHIQLQFAPS